MAREEDRPGGAELPHEIAEGDDLQGIEAVSRFVEDDHGGIVDERRREPDPLAVARRALLDPLPERVGEPARRRDPCEAVGEHASPKSVRRRDEREQAIGPHFLVERRVARKVADAPPDLERVLRPRRCRRPRRRPDVGWRYVAMILRSVLFPAPFGPTKPTISFFSRAKLTESTATRFPKRLVTESTVIMHHANRVHDRRRASRTRGTRRGFPDLRQKPDEAPWPGMPSGPVFGGIPEVFSGLRAVH